MHTEGYLAPTTVDAARERYEGLEPTAKTIVREVASAMEFEPAEYEERVTEDVLVTARDALFASLLEARVGSREAFEEWREDHPGYDTEVAGSEHVARVVWHVAPFAERAVAATFEDAERAAIGALRRQAFGRIYREVL